MKFQKVPMACSRISGCFTGASVVPRDASGGRMVSVKFQMVSGACLGGSEGKIPYYWNSLRIHSRISLGISLEIRGTSWSSPGTLFERPSGVSPRRDFSWSPMIPCHNISFTSLLSI